MRDLRGLIKKDEYDEGGWCFDEKRNLIHNLVKTLMLLNWLTKLLHKTQVMLLTWLRFKIKVLVALPLPRALLLLALSVPAEIVVGPE